MKKCFFVLCLIFICFAKVPAQRKISAEEYKVYAAILKDIYQINFNEYKTKSAFVILNSTFQPDFVGTYKVSKIKGLLNNFRRANKTIAVLDEQISVKYDYTIIDKSEIDVLLKIGEANLKIQEAEYKKRNIGIRGGSDYIWEPFYKKFPNANGYYQFSKTGFSSNRKFAVVYVERKAGSSGDSTIYILKKIKGIWKINFSYGGSWVS